MSEVVAGDWPVRSRQIVRDSLAVGLAIGSYGVSYGALAVTTGLSVIQTCLLSVVAFTGGSQFAFIGVLGAGGSPWSGTLTGLLLGLRNSFYGLRLTPMLGLHAMRSRVLAAQFVIDETTAMAIANERADPRDARLAFWTTGLAIFVMWNLTTLLGAISVSALGDPTRWGLDAAAPAAFLALLWPRLTTTPARTVAIGGALVALVLTPLVTPGIPVLAAGLVAVAVGIRQVRSGQEVR